jgi:tetratricopeptide (TPR) repeat protein
VLFEASVKLPIGIALLGALTFLAASAGHAQDRTAFIAIGDAQYAQSHFKEALAAYEQAAALTSKESNPLEWADTHSLVTKTLARQGDRSRCLALREEVLAVYEKKLPPADQRVTWALLALGSSYETAGRRDQAEQLYRRALAINERLYSPDDPHLAAVFHSLASVNHSGRYEEAEYFYRRLLAIDERRYGNEDKRITDDLDSIACMLKARNKLEEAFPFYRRSVLIKEKEELRQTHGRLSTPYAQFYTESLRQFGWSEPQISAELASIEQQARTD